MSNPSTLAYSVSRFTRACASTGHEFAQGEAYIGALFQTVESDEVVRRDYKADAWDPSSAAGEGETLFGYWRGVAGREDQSTGFKLDDGSLIELFERSGDRSGDNDEPDEDRLALRYVLTLVLVRKRVLHLLEERTEGGRTVLRVRARKCDGGSEHEVCSVPIAGEMLSKLADRLGTLLEG